MRDERPPTYADRVLEHRGWHRPQEPARGTSARDLCATLRGLLEHVHGGARRDVQRALGDLETALSSGGVEGIRNAMREARGVLEMLEG